MTLIEAIKTGKDFKRPDGDYIANTYDPKTGFFDDLYQLGLTMADVLADDWEIEEHQKDERLKARRRTFNPVSRRDKCSRCSILILRGDL